MTQARLLALAAATLASAAAGAAYAESGIAVRQNQDGVYAVDVTTQQGGCDRDYHWLISVSAGRVSSAGDSPVEASGQINPRGIVDLEFQRFGQVATAKGRLAKGSGSGTWSSPTMQCAGSWRAIRQS